MRFVQRVKAPLIWGGCEGEPPPQAEQIEELSLGQRRGVEADILHHLLKRFSLLFERRVYPLLNRVRADVAVDSHRIGLPDTMHAAIRLLFYRGVPPAVKVKHVGGGLQIQPLRPRFQGE